MRVFLTIIVLLLFPAKTFSQSFTENDIKQLAQKINDKTRGNNIGNGITVRGCSAYGRTLVYQYDVDENWLPAEKMKEILISNFKEAGNSTMFFNNDVNVDFHYFAGNNLIKKIGIKSNEFSTLNFKLGNYISIDGHPKSKGVNLKLRIPIGWDLKEGDRPNIVKKFVYKNNNFMILIKNFNMFYSRKEAKGLLDDKEYSNNLLTGINSFLKGPEILNQKVVTVGNYPALEYHVKGSIERLGFNLKIIMKGWIIFYEDKIVILQCSSNNEKDFKNLERLYYLITNSVIFPEQYD